MGDLFRQKNTTQKKRTTPKSAKNKTLHKGGGKLQTLLLILFGFLLLVGKTNANGGPLRDRRRVNIHDDLFSNGQSFETNILKLQELARAAGLSETQGFFQLMPRFDLRPPQGDVTQKQAAAAAELAKELRKEFPEKKIQL